MRVALVHDHLVQDGGAERVLRSLMNMYPEAPVFVAFYDADKMGDDFRGKDIRTSWLQRIPGATKHYKFLLLLLHHAFRRFDLRGYDLVISSASGWAKSVRTGSQTRHVCYCHTPIRYIWSDSERYIAETGYSAPLKLLFKVCRPLLRRRDLQAAGGVDQFVANSHFVAERIKRYYQRSSTVVYPPVDISAFAPSRQQKPYFLVATRLEPYKRVDLVIKTCNALQLPLVVMGSGTDATRLQALAGPTVSFTGRVSDARRRTLFAEAQALINPQEEDFGITAVEALASGTPVIAYGVGGAAEILGDGFGVLFTPQTEAALTAALRQYDRAAFDPQALRTHATAFSETRFAEEVRSVVSQAA